MFSGEIKSGSLVFFLSCLLVLTGAAYYQYLVSVFPKLVPSYGGGERFVLDKANNYTSQMPWSANTRLHITLEANDTIELYADGEYLCDCTSYEFQLEGRENILLMIKSSSPVNGKFTAWQETPPGKKLASYGLITAGLIGILWSIRKRKLLKKL